MERKGQAALEFLMTYGWAILAAIIVIGVLAYFGVFSPGKFIPTAAVLSPPLYANAWQVKNNVAPTEDTVKIEIKNNGGDTITVTDFQLANVFHDNVAYTTCSVADNVPTDLNLAPGATPITVSVNCGTGLASGKTFKADIAVKYKKIGGTLELSSTGTMADKVV